MPPTKIGPSIFKTPPYRKRCRKLPQRCVKCGSAMAIDEATLVGSGILIRKSIAWVCTKCKHVAGKVTLEIDHVI